MGEEIINELGTPDEIKQFNRWIIRFELSDAELYAVMDLIGQVIWGDIDLDEFWQRLQTATVKNSDIKRELAVAIANNRFMDYKDDIGDVAGFIKRLGGSVAQPAAKSEPRPAKDESEIGRKLSAYDWNSITGIARRARLEELGVSLKEFVRWMQEQK